MFFPFARDVNVGTMVTSTSTLYSSVIAMPAQITNYMVCILNTKQMIHILICNAFYLGSSILE